MRLLNDWRFVAIFCLTLGLAPYTPEPHLWGKLKWIAGGGQGMTPMDIWDAVMHGTPWLLAMRLVFKSMRPARPEEL